MREDPLDSHKSGQRARKKRQIEAEVSAALSAKKYVEAVKKNPIHCAFTAKMLIKRLRVHGFRRRTLASLIKEKGPQLLEIEETIEEIRGRRAITWKTHKGL